jgi:putative aldouronate transport system permease protein
MKRGVAVSVKNFLQPRKNQSISLEANQGVLVRRKRKINWPLHLMILPAVILLFIYSYIPMFGIIIAFKDFDILLGKRAIFDSAWVGLQNYKELMDMGIMSVLYNTIFIAFLKIFTMFFIPIIVAISLNEVTKTLIKRSVQTVIYMPHFLSWVILAGILKTILSENGLVNSILNSVGIENIPFLSSNKWFVPTIILTNIWKEFGFSTIVYLAAITSIDPGLYEAAIIDGANRWKQTIHVTLPGMKPIIVLTLILSLQGVLNAGFDQIFNLYSVPVYQTGDIIDTFVYRISFGQAMYDIGTAVGLFKSIVSTIFISLSYWMAYKFANYEIF